MLVINEHRVVPSYRSTSLSSTPFKQFCWGEIENDLHNQASLWTKNNIIEKGDTLTFFKNF